MSGRPTRLAAYCLDVGMPTPPGLPHPHSILDAVNDALQELVARDRELLEHGAHELAHVHRFGVYVERRLSDELAAGQLTIDLDYDRDGQLAKETHFDPPLRSKTDEDGTSRFRPDLIIHRRGREGPNVLVLEWKKHAGPDAIALLQQRLEHIQRAFRYTLGVIVNSYEDRVEWCIVENESDSLVWRIIRGPDVAEAVPVPDVS
jgi:hypothetical protein